MPELVTRDKFNKPVYEKDLIRGPDGYLYQVIKTKPNTFNVWDLGRTPKDHVFNSDWFTKRGDFMKVTWKEEW